MDSESELILRAAWLYHFEGLKQEAVAERLGIKRVKVVRLLKEAISRGIVEVRLNPETFSLFRLGERLKELTGLDDAVVVPTTEKLFNSLSAGAAHLVNTFDFPAGDLGIGMGRTLQSFPQYLELKTNCFKSVVTLCGNANPDLSIMPYSIGFDVAKKLEIDFFNIWAPLVIASATDVRVFRNDRFISSVLEKANHVSAAIVGIGSLEDSSLLKMDYISQEELNQISGSKAVGEILGNFFSKSGEKISTVIDERVIAVAFPMDCKVIGVAGGKDKIDPIVGAIRNGYINMLATDENTAHKVISIFENQ